jgi:hypothetical protein
MRLGHGNVCGGCEQLKPVAITMVRSRRRIVPGPPQIAREFRTRPLEDCPLAIVSSHPAPSLSVHCEQRFETAAASDQTRQRRGYAQNQHGLGNNPAGPLPDT